MHSFLLSLSVLVGVVSSAVANHAESAVGYVDVASVAGSIGSLLLIEKGGVGC